MAPRPRLTSKQRLFVEHYLQCWNATEAAARAGYRGDRLTLGAVGRQNLRKATIRARIDRRMVEVAMGTDEVLARLAEHARLDPADLLEALRYSSPAEILEEARKLGKSHLIKSVKHTQHGVNVEFHDVQRALELIGRAHGLFTDVVVIREKVERELDQALAKLEAGLSPDEYRRVLDLLCEEDEAGGGHELAAVR